MALDERMLSIAIQDMIQDHVETHYVAPMQERLNAEALLRADLERRIAALEATPPRAPRVELVITTSCGVDRE